MTTDSQEAPNEVMSDRRSANRQISVLINAGIVHRGNDALCRIRNLSPGGVMIECPLPLAIDDEIELHLRSGRHVTGHVRWVEDGRAGIAFDDPASAELVGATQQPAAKRISIRRQAEEASPIGYPVFRRRCWAQLAAGNLRAQVPVAYISSTGLVVENIVEWGGERLFSVSIEGLGRYAARLCDGAATDHGETVGLLFVEPVLYRNFNDWLMATPRPAEGMEDHPVENGVRTEWL